MTEKPSAAKDACIQVFVSIQDLPSTLIFFGFCPTLANNSL